MPIHEPANYLDQLIRQTRQHHVALSTMADQKANMLLTMSSVVLTLSLPQLARPEYRSAVIALMSACLLTLILACYVVMPKLLFGRDKRPIAERNLLFFADFEDLSFEQYKTEMATILNDPAKAYDLQLQEIYRMGQYLAWKKYRFLRWAYLTFLAGFVIAAALLVT